MNVPAANAAMVILSGLAALFLLYAASLWVGLSRHDEKPNERPSIPVARFRSAAGATAVALGLLGIALLWATFVHLP